MVIPTRVWLPWAICLLAVVVAVVAVGSARSRADDAEGALEVARARAAGLTVAERVPLIAPPPYSKLRETFPAAKVTDRIVVRTEYVPVLAPEAGNPSGDREDFKDAPEREPTVPDGASTKTNTTCVVTSEDRLSVTVDTTLWRLPAGTRTLEGWATVTRERGDAVIARAPIKADLSRWLAVAPLSPGERPRWAVTGAYDLIDGAWAVGAERRVVGPLWVGVEAGRGTFALRGRVEW